MTEELLVKTLLDARPRLVAGALAVVRDVHSAEDVFQEVLLRALRMRESFSDEGGLLAWARVTARNLGIDQVRRSGRLGEILSELALDAMHERLEAASDSQRLRAEAMRFCVEKLPEESRTLLRLRYDEGHKGPELSRLLRRNEAAIYKALSRLHQALRLCINQRLAAQEGTQS
ncbi:MAG: sigma-70 family RNA polymerase sigma factor [Verrucomicrobia bacterium]|nr:sigma-70 family RNA polymerase sigma factor [Verrucomicrobiota bacterium]